MRLINSGACRGLVDTAGEMFPKTGRQGFVFHWYRNVFSHVPNGKVAEVARMLKALHAREGPCAAQAKAAEVASRLKEISYERLRNWWSKREARHSAITVTPARIGDR